MRYDVKIDGRWKHKDRGKIAPHGGAWKIVAPSATGKMEAFKTDGRGKTAALGRWKMEATAPAVPMHGEAAIFMRGLKEGVHVTHSR